MIEKKCQERGIEHFKIGDIHDEGQHEAPVEEANLLGEIKVQAIREAGEELGFTVPMDGDYKVGLSWAETH
jgi:DNA polymerase-1